MSVGNELIVEMVRDMKSSVENIERAMYGGNGNKGLSTRVALLEQQGAAVRYGVVILVSLLSSTVSGIIIAVLLSPK